MAEVDISKLHILVVEDEIYTRKVMTRVLKGIGTGKISLAKDGYRALAILQEAKWRVDVILLDLQMPRVNGYEFIKRLHAEFEPPLSETPVVVISGHSEKKELDRARGLGVGLFLLKPITPEQVVTRINAAVRHKFE
ncbi:MAG: response regulator [Proteobacteria bacterium]|nr:response regulator [Pseudomonadota bacterium]